jgi:heme A synthase
MHSMELLARLGASLLRTPAVIALYRHLVLSHRPWTRCFGLCVLAVVYGLRTARQFSNRRLKLTALAALVFTQAALSLLPKSLLAPAAGCIALVAATALACIAGFQPEDGIGHRCGVKGFNGQWNVSGCR